MRFLIELDKEMEGNKNNQRILEQNQALKIHALGQQNEENGLIHWIPTITVQAADDKTHRRIDWCKRAAAVKGEGPNAVQQSAGREGADEDSENPEHRELERMFDRRPAQEEIRGAERHNSGHEKSEECCAENESKLH